MILASSTERRPRERRAGTCPFGRDPRRVTTSEPCPALAARASTTTVEKRHAHRGNEVVNSAFASHRHFTDATSLTQGQRKANFRVGACELASLRGGGTAARWRSKFRTSHESYWTHPDLDSRWLRFPPPLPRRTNMPATRAWMQAITRREKFMVASIGVSRLGSSARR